MVRLEQHHDDEVNLTFHGDSIGQVTSCDDCGREWETIYTLTGYSS